MSDLPKFRPRRYDEVMKFISEVLSRPGQSGGTALHRLIEYQDGHYRAIFGSQYFMLSDERAEPSKSQWSTLKKRLKRHHRGVFVFKQHGETDCQTASLQLPKQGEERCFYIDFGFFAH